MSMPDIMLPMWMWEYPSTHPHCLTYAIQRAALGTKHGHLTFWC